MSAPATTITVGETNLNVGPDSVNSKPQAPSALSTPDTAQVFQRFYHVFKQSELENLVVAAGQAFPHIDLRLDAAGWEKGNWYGIWQCMERV